MREEKKQRYDKHGNPFPKNHGMPWTVDEMWKLVILYNQKITWVSVAEKMQRTVAACRSHMRIIRHAVKISKSDNFDQIVKEIEKNPHAYKTTE